MRRKFITVVFCIIALAALAYHAAARTMVVVVGQGATGSTEPASGTVLGGQQTTSGGNDYYSDAYELYYDNGGYTVTWTESASTTTAAKMQVYGAEHWGGNCKGVLYTAAGALVAATNSVSTVGWTAGWQDLAFGSAPTVTKGDTYKMGVYCDSGADYQWWYAASGTQYYDTAGTFASPPSTLSGSEITTNVAIAIRLVK